MCVLDDGRQKQLENKSTDWKVGEVPNYENIKNKGFDKRTTSELRDISSKGGKSSGEARRRKADFRKTLNMLLTAEIDNPEWTPFLQALGLDSTLESAVNMAMIKEALAGNVKAYVAIRDTIGQTTKSDKDLDEQNEKIKSIRFENEEKRKKGKTEESGCLSDIIEEAFMKKE